ncbi:MAG: hypothetical protein QOJ90_2145 [Actinomycetota bacterium]|jgi:hypothetical protein|nr:hypothetical protein [Actinomycetota bacterium]MDQ1642794.1 hypothetical protein [Actinomycetota bacterium]
MTTQPLPLASFPELVATALSVVSRRVVDGSRRNADEAIAAIRAHRDDQPTARDLVDLGALAGVRDSEA